jgi:hypothetical protein
MKATKNLSIIAVATLFSFASLGTAFAVDRSELAFASEVETCISAVNANVDLLNATRVRHVVKQQDHAGSAYAFTIDTSVFTNKSEKHYAAYCVANGDHEPSRFRIAEKSI